MEGRERGEGLFTQKLNVEYNAGQLVSILLFFNSKAIRYVLYVTFVLCTLLSRVVRYNGHVLHFPFLSLTPAFS
jgi:hypothetical protein